MSLVNGMAYGICRNVIFLHCLLKWGLSPVSTTLDHLDKSNVYMLANPSSPSLAVSNLMLEMVLSPKSALRLQSLYTFQQDIANKQNLSESLLSLGPCNELNWAQHDCGTSFCYHWQRDRQKASDFATTLPKASWLTLQMWIFRLYAFITFCYSLSP